MDLDDGIVFLVYSFCISCKGLNHYDKNKISFTLKIWIFFLLEGVLPYCQCYDKHQNISDVVPLLDCG